MSHGYWPEQVVRVYLLLLLGFLLPLPGWTSTPPTGNLTGPPFLQDSLRKEFIKFQILQRLGLQEKPVVDLSHKISRDLVLETLRRTDGLLDLENIAGGASRSNASGGGGDGGGTGGTTNYAKTSEIISFPEKGPVFNDQTLLTFSFAGNNAFGLGTRVRKAHLWVKMNYESNLGAEFVHVLYPKGVTLYIFQVQGNFSHADQLPTHLRPQDVSLDMVISRTIPVESLGWQKLDVTAVVNKWYSKLSRHRIRHPHSSSHSRGKSNSKLTLLVDCSGCGVSVKPVVFGTSTLQPSTLDSVEIENSSADEPPRHQIADTLTEIPFLVLETETAQNVKRNRRRTLECSPRVKQCCKQRFFISFVDLGWEDWIIAPRGYYANYCRGHCGGVHRTPDTFLNYHTHVMEEYRRTAAGQMELSSLTPCCAPTKFSSMSLIYFGPDLNIIKRDLPKMIVEECGCP